MVLVKAFEVTMQSFMALALNVISTALEIRHAAWKCIHTELGHPRRRVSVLRSPVRSVMVMRRDLELSKFQAWV